MKLNRWFIGDLAGNIAAILLAALVIVAVSAVLLRYIAGSPLSWSEEFEVLTLIWIIMIGAIYAKRNNTLLRMDILFNVLPASVRRPLAIFQELVHCGIFFLMIRYGYGLAMQVGAKTMPLLGIPLFWLYLALPVGACGMLIITLIQLYDMITGKGEI